MIIDAHQHFWQLSRGDYPWPNADVAPIFRDFLPADLAPLLQRNGIRQTILVQATDTLAETEFLLTLAEQNTLVAGVVGWVDLARSDAISHIDRLRQDPHLKGLRPMLQNIAETDWILHPDVQLAVAHLENVGLCFDALVQPRHLRTIATLAQTFPRLKIVIDHAAKPAILGGADAGDDWRNGMAQLAAFKNVHCKISGLATEAGPDWSVAGLQPVVDHLLDSFGPARVMWGSDWPVLNLAGDYDRWWQASTTLLRGLSPAERSDVFGGTAARFYGLGGTT